MADQTPGQTPADGVAGPAADAHAPALDVDDSAEVRNGGLPIAADQRLVGLEDTPLTVVTGGQGPGITVEVLVFPDRGEVVAGPGAGELTYTPLPRWNGFDGFTYRLTSPGGSDDGRVELTIYASVEEGAPQVLLPQTGLRPRDLGVVMSGLDPLSMEVGETYAAMRGIPPENLVVLDVPTDITTLTPTEFAPLYAQLHQSLPPDIQAIAVAWTQPWRVGCMSMTSALALGYEPGFCHGDASEGGCRGTAPVDTYLSESARPWDDHGVRPAMMLAGQTPEEVVALVERGIASDRTRPTGTAYLLRTSDAERSIRWSQMLAALLEWDGIPPLSLAYLDNSGGALGSDLLTDADDVLFYFTGLPTVDDIDTNTYLPGAIADHLTSLGGQLTDSTQMSALRWLEAGAVAAYGTVVEPCNLVDKFPNVRFVLQLYTRGETALEAYWKSVKTPGEGIFVGEPLANPWGRHVIRWSKGTLTIETTMLRPGQALRIETSDQPEGPFEVLADGLTAPDLGPAIFMVENTQHPVYRIVREPPP